MKTRIVLTAAAGTVAALLAIGVLSTPANASGPSAQPAAGGQIQDDGWYHHNTYTVERCRAEAKLWRNLGKEAECRNSDGIHAELWLRG